MFTYSFRNFDEVNEVLIKYVPPPRPERGVYTLDRIIRLLHFLDDPQDKYKVVHVAGTSGKTSTCYYLAAMLTASGVKVGLTVSPHVDRINERVQINMDPLAEGKFCSEFELFMNEVAKSNIQPTYFEILVAFAFWEFARQEVDYAVIEVGLGGLLDGTNVIDRQDKVCVITDIGLDHTTVLGKTLSEIATQKAGIIKDNNDVFTYVQSSEIMSVFKQASNDRQARLFEIASPSPVMAPGELALYQKRNWYLALNVYKHLSARYNLTKLTDTELYNTANTVVPARMEIATIGKKIIIMDGAHNSQKMQALVSSVQNRFGNEPIAVLFSLVQSQRQRVISTLGKVTKIASHVTLTEFETVQDMHKKSVRKPMFIKCCEEINLKAYKFIDNPKDALQYLLSRPEKILLITGSFYLLNLLRPLIWEHDKTYRSG